MDTPPQRAPALEDRLVEALRREGTPEGEGSFTLGSADAVSKLEVLRGEHPWSWVLHVARGLVRAGVSQVAARDGLQHLGRLVLRSPEPIHMPTDVGALWPVVAGAAQSAYPGTREIILGMVMGCNDGLSRVELASGPTRLVVEGTDVQLWTEPDQADRGFWLRASGETAPRRQGRRAEIWALSERARFSPVQLDLGFVRPDVPGSVVRDAIRLPRGNARLELPSALRVTLGYSPGAPPEIRVVVDGVWIESRRVEAAPDGYIAVLAGDFQLDAALRRCVEDHQLTDALAKISAQLPRVGPVDPEDRRRVDDRVESDLKKLRRWPRLAVPLALVALIVSAWRLEAWCAQPESPNFWLIVRWIWAGLPVLVPAYFVDEFFARKRLPRRFPPSHWFRARVRPSRITAGRLWLPLLFVFFVIVVRTYRLQYLERFGADIHGSARHELARILVAGVAWSALFWTLVTMVGLMFLARLFVPRQRDG